MITIWSNKGCILNYLLKGYLLQEKIDAMKMLKLITIAICCLFVSGCARFIVPEIGSIAQRLTGELVFDRSLTDSFPVVKTFFLKMSWLDTDGSVLKTVDVTPHYGYLISDPGTLKVNKMIDTVPGSAFISFNYFGVFRGEKPDVSGEWDIFLFPFTTP